MRNTTLTTLSAQALTCRVNEKTIFQNINFSISAGQSLLIHGPNGSGKSSLLKALSQLTLPYYVSGQLFINNKAYLAQSTNKDYEEQISYIPTSNRLIGNTTVIEFLVYLAAFYGIKDKSKLENLLNIFSLSHLANLNTQFLSFGQIKKLYLTTLFLKDFKLWILDEPTLGLDNASFSLLENLINLHCADGGMVIISSHTPLNLKNLTTLELY